MKTRDRVYSKAFFDASTVIRLSHGPYIVALSDLQQQVPTEDIFAAFEPWQPRRTTGKNTGQDTSPGGFRFQKEFTDLAQNVGVEGSSHFRDTNKRLHHRSSIVFAIDWT